MNCHHVVDLAILTSSFVKEKHINVLEELPYVPCVPFLYLLTLF